MPDASQAVVRVKGREQPNVVALPDELLGKRFDVLPDTPRIRIRVRGDECYAHRCIVDECPGGSDVAAQLPSRARMAGRPHTYPVANSRPRKPSAKITGPESFESAPITVAEKLPQMPAMNAGWSRKGA